MKRLKLALHSATDLVSDVVTYVTFNKARTPKSQKFPYGYGRLETLGAFSVSAILSAGAIGMAFHSYDALFTPHTHLTMHPWALGLAAISVLVKEVLFHSTMKIGKRIKSDLIIANAWHHRSDSATSLVALVSIAGAVIHPSLMFLDPIGGILVSALVFKAGLDSGIPAFKELIEASMAEDVNTRIAHKLKYMMENETNITGFDAIRSRKMGPYTLIDLQLRVHPHLSVSTAHQITENVRHHLMKSIEGISEVLIHVDCEHHDHDMQPVATSKPISEIEQLVRKNALKGMENHVLCLSHLTLHYDPQGFHVKCEIRLKDESIQFYEAAAIARQVQQNILDLKGIVEADVHLEVNEH